MRYNSVVSRSAPFDPARLASPLLRRFHDHWSAKRGERAMPGFDAFDPVEFTWALGNLTVIDVLRDPLRFRYRLVGGKHVARLGSDMTGRLVDDFASSALRRILIETYTQAVEAGTPLHRTRWDVVAGVDHHYEAIILPLSAEPPRVDMLMVCAEYLDRKVAR